MEVEPPESVPQVSLGQSPQPAAAAGTIPLTAPSPIPDRPVYRDRTTGLMIFGVFQIILGLLAALMVPLVALGAFMSRLATGGAMRPGQVISGMLTYASVAAVLFTLGVGSAQTKRWARALTLVISWYWLITGVFVTVLITAVLPVTMRGMLAALRQNAAGTSSPGFSTGVMAVVLTFIIVLAAIFLVMVPAAFVIFYSRRDVAETCRRRDPIERWTDRAPLPVLGASIVLFAGSLYMLLSGVTLPMFPFFGQYLIGIRAAGCFFVLAAIDLYAAVALFRLRSSGWWIAMLTTSIRLLSMAITFRRADLMQAYSKLGWSDAQVQVLNASPMFRSHVILWWSLMSLVLFFGYLLWLKRYVKTSVAAQPNAFHL